MKTILKDKDYHINLLDNGMYELSYKKRVLGIDNTPGHLFELYLEIKGESYGKKKVLFSNFQEMVSLRSYYTEKV